MRKITITVITGLLYLSLLACATTDKNRLMQEQLLPEDYIDITTHGNIQLHIKNGDLWFHVLNENITIIFRIDTVFIENYIPTEI